MGRTAALLLTLVLTLPPAAGAQNGGGIDRPAGVRPAGEKPAAALAPSYRVGPADVLTVTVYDEPDLDGDFTVDPDGRIDYPLLGQVAVAGMTTAEIKETLTGLLERDYLYEAVVSARVKEHKSQKVEIHGDVGKPGVYYLDGPLRLLDLLVRADGLSNTLGNPTSRRPARIVRPAADSSGSGGRELSTAYVDLHDLLVEGRQEANLPLAAGDVVYIPPILEEASRVHVLGEVTNPGTLPYEEGMTVLRAITLANGATKKAVLRKAFVRREQDGEILEIPVRIEDPLQPGDILTIPVSFW